MPQQKKTEGFGGFDQEVLDAATPQQREFALFLIQGKTGAESYRLAYDASNMSANAVTVEASRLRSHPNVSLWMDAYRMAGLQRGKRTLGQHLDRLTELSVKAELSGNYGAAVNAEHHAGKASGLYEEKHVVRDERPQDVERELHRLLGLSQDTAEDSETGHCRPVETH